MGKVGADDGVARGPHARSILEPTAAMRSCIFTGQQWRIRRQNRLGEKCAVSGSDRPERSACTPNGESCEQCRTVYGSHGIGRRYTSPVEPFPESLGSKCSRSPFRAMSLGHAPQRRILGAIAPFPVGCRRKARQLLVSNGAFDFWAKASFRCVSQRSSWISKQGIGHDFQNYSLSPHLLRYRLRRTIAHRPRR